MIDERCPYYALEMANLSSINSMISIYGSSPPLYCVECGVEVVISKDDSGRFIITHPVDGTNK